MPPRPQGQLGPRQVAQFPCLCHLAPSQASRLVNDSPFFRDPPPVDRFARRHFGQRFAVFPQWPPGCRFARRRGGVLVNNSPFFRDPPPVDRFARRHFGQRFAVFPQWPPGCRFARRRGGVLVNDSPFFHDGPPGCRFARRRGGVLVNDFSLFRVGGGPVRAPPPASRWHEPPRPSPRRGAHSTWSFRMNGPLLSPRSSRTRPAGNALRGVPRVPQDRNGTEAVPSSRPHRRPNRGRGLATVHPARLCR